MAEGPPSVKVTPEFLAESNAGQLTAANTIILVLATILLGLRLYVRTLTNATRGWDEFLLPVSWILLLGLVVVNYISIPLGGVGYHVQRVVAEDPHKLTRWLQLEYALVLFYIPSGTLSRMSVVLLYLRLFTSKVSRFFCWTIMVLLIAQCIALIVADNLACRPFAYFWDKTIPGGKCFNIVLWDQITNVPNVALDISILILPMPTIWKLHASYGRKASIAVVCLTGSLGLVFSCVRTGVFFTSSTVVGQDPTWQASPLLMWTILESGMYFCSACLIGLRPLLSRVTTWLKGHNPSFIGTLIAKTKTSHNHKTKSMKGNTAVSHKINTLKWSGSSFDDDSLSRIIPAPAPAHTQCMQSEGKVRHPEDMQGITVETTIDIEADELDRKEMV